MLCMSTTPSQILLLFSFYSNSKPDYFSSTDLEKNEMTIFEEAASIVLFPLSVHTQAMSSVSLFFPPADTETVGSSINNIPGLKRPILDTRRDLILW